MFSVLLNISETNIRAIGEKYPKISVAAPLTDVNADIKIKQ
jgi:hypothetical protein